MNSSRWFASGALAALDSARREQLIRRGNAQENPALTVAAEIVQRVRTEGDTALREFATRFDNVHLETLGVSRNQIDAARASLAPDVRAALTRAAGNIRAVHADMRPESVEIMSPDGVRIVRRCDPLERVGVYAPGGRAAYPSSVLMTAIPARVAGVREIVLCSPPGPDGVPSPLVLAAAAIAGVDRVFAVGGAGAIAAMAYGTESIPRVDRIVGPGNAFVAAAKQIVSADVGIDSPAGPSELLIIADASADPRVIAREAIAQAEHDPDAGVIVLCSDVACASAAAECVDRLLETAPRASIISSALRTRGALLVVDDISGALAFCEEYAPEHALVLTVDAEECAGAMRNAGTVFLGTGSSVAFGDYITGANHVLPTGGAARSFSGLSTTDFMRWTTIQMIDRTAAGRLAADTALLATAEGLPGHAAAAMHWSTTQ